MTAAVTGIGLVDGRAVEHLRALEPVVRTDFDLLSQRAKRRAFTAAGLTRDAMVEAVHREIVRAVDEGRTFDEFRRDVDQVFESAGYAPERGRAGWRAEQTFRLQVSRAHAASRREAFDDPAVADQFPYLMYDATDDGRTRPEHRRLDGKVLRRDDPFWDRYTPPWEYGCRCSVVPLTARQAERLGATIEPRGKLAEAMEISDRRPDPPFADGNRTLLAGGGRDRDFDRYRPSAAQPYEDPEQLGVPPIDRRLPSPDAPPPSAEMPTVDGLRGAGLSRQEAAGQVADELASRLGLPSADRAVELPTPDGGAVGVRPRNVERLDLDGRERSLGDLARVLSEPDEIWLAEWESPDGGLQLRRQFVKRLGGEDGRTLVATVRNGEWVDWQELTAASRGLRDLRRGIIQHVRSVA